ncbi:hemerythrin domain-containing protein [Nocardia anaemiae]|uniref:hemerythrin domain-containing protein n=1 Tax=Nocardia anaemiae TaxID=263910 RepID=UPI0007A3A144|nr:hemerythrin domain-containing protein [Nocardia anaemiae]
MTSNPAVTTRVTPDVTGMKIAHRGMIADTRRFAQITARIAAGSPCPPRRAAAITEYLNLLCDSIHHHHTIEDDVLWPVLIASAGPAVDVRELEDDHIHVDELLATLRTRAAAFAVASDKQAAAAALAETLETAHTLLSEHIADEEKVVFPIIDEHVTLEDWARIEKAAKQGGNLKFEVPRVLQHATEPELVRMKQDAGLAIRLMLKVLVRGFNKREAIIAG